MFHEKFLRFIRKVQNLGMFFEDFLNFVVFSKILIISTFSTDIQWGTHKSGFLCKIPGLVMRTPCTVYQLRYAIFATQTVDYKKEDLPESNLTDVLIINK